ncbi:MAG TPA: peptidoglycan editing factor PgeF [Armatimonadetes bacterium]|nr:peptidoglycan editing factor PgeF [Armatimonadota bacterium]
MTWETQLDWPRVVGGFIGRTTRSTRAETVAEAVRSMGGTRIIVDARQVHGAEVAVVDDAALDRECVTIERVDGFVTASPRAALVIYVADCLAIFLSHEGAPAVGLAHAGWRGLAADMPGVLVRTALEAFGGSPSDLRLALSPCIRDCCFEVGEEVAEQFDAISGAVDRSHAKPHLDMIAIATAQLREAGVPAERIEVMDGCTRCDPKRFASYRWDRERCGRNVAMIGLG